MRAAAERPQKREYRKLKEVISCETVHFPPQLPQGCRSCHCTDRSLLGAPAASAEETNCFLGEKSAVTILYTNDVHTYIDKKSPELTYAGIAALKQSYVDAGQNVLLVDAGDHIQGTAYGSMDDGETIIKLMSEAGYDLATPATMSSTTAWPAQRQP